MSSTGPFAPVAQIIDSVHRRPHLTGSTSTPRVSRGVRRERMESPGTTGPAWQGGRRGHPVDRAPHAVAGHGRMLDAALRGATDPDITGVEVVRRPALAASPADVLAANAVLLGTPANLGYMSGALKHFFDQIYYPVLDATKGLPYALYVHGNLGTEGAVRSVEQIAGGLGCGPWRRRSRSPGRPAATSLRLAGSWARCWPRAWRPSRPLGSRTAPRAGKMHAWAATRHPGPGTAALDRAEGGALSRRRHLAHRCDPGAGHRADHPVGRPARAAPAARGGGDHVGVGGSLPATCFPRLRAGLVLEPGAGPGDRRRARRRGPGPGRRRRARPRAEHQALPAVRAQLRVSVRGPVPGRPDGRGSWCGASRRTASAPVRSTSR